MAALELCEAVRKRQAQDKRKGHTTSQGAIDFIRRTCPCLSCYAGRQRAAAPPPVRTDA